MPIHEQLAAGPEFDVIIAGGGTAGCIVAARLVEADPNLSVLVIEQGPNNDTPTVETPVLFHANIFPETGTNIFYQANESPHLNGRAPLVSSGGVLGGGSSTNFMMYSRPQRSDLDAWNMAGWSADDLLPGPIHVSSGTFRSTRVQESFITAASTLSIPIASDLFDRETPIGVQRAQRFISPTGARQDTATRYLLPLLPTHTNLHILLRHAVQRIIFSHRRATAAQLQSGITVKAKKQIILSTGALGTPLLLQRSGIGLPSILSRAGIPLVHALPVREQYLDHNLFYVPYYSSLEEHETLDALASGRAEPREEMLGWNAQDVTCKLRPREDQLGPFASVWADFVERKDRPMGLMSLVVANPLLGVEAGAYFAVSAFTAHPYSRGHIFVGSAAGGDGKGGGKDANKEIDFDAGILKEQVDLEMCKWLYKTQREIARRMDVYRGEYEAGHPPFAEGSEAACGRRDGPTTGGEIQYSEDDEKVLEDWLRANVGTTWHSLGTCPMGKVVDERLRVIGVEGLRIADLSVCPGNVAANTGFLAMVVGEKAAALFGEDLGVDLSV
ncbi:hypothetical protein OQA88_10940 [Cercophora sp. LCS_1]